MLNRLLRLYKTSQQRTPLEDFTTEVFAGILNMEMNIKHDFLLNMLCLPNDDYCISTQVTYPRRDDRNCIIDMVIESKSSICFIENKVESEEGEGQLGRYCKILDEKAQDGKATFLIYCTKYHDPKYINRHNFKQIRWYQIASLLKPYAQISFVDHFIAFLKSKDMSQELTLNAEDFVSLLNLQNIISKTYEYLSRAKPAFENVFGRNKKADLKTHVDQIIKHNRIIVQRKEVLGDGWSDLKYGFLLYKPEIYAGLWVDSNNKEYKKFIEEANKYAAINFTESFDVKEINSGAFMELKKDISIFLNDERADSEIQKWFEMAFILFSRFIKETPELKWTIILPAIDLN